MISLILTLAVIWVVVAFLFLFALCGAAKQPMPGAERIAEDEIADSQEPKLDIRIRCEANASARRTARAWMEEIFAAMDRAEIRRCGVLNPKFIQ